jgi:predicted neutral ceramidase superfamily lipid hydrolase
MKDKVKLTIIVITVIWVTLSVISLISEFTVNTNDSTVGNFSFVTLLRTSWYPILITLTLILSYVLYNKKYRYGAILEMLTGGIMLSITITNIIDNGVQFLAVMLLALLPLILIIQGVMIVINKEDKKGEIKVSDTKIDTKKEKATKATNKSRKVNRKTKK